MQSITGTRPLSREHREKISQGMKGHRIPLVVREKISLTRKGGRHSPETIEKIRKSQKVGKESVYWKGDKVSYNGLHYWIYSKLGKPNTCEHCGKDRLRGCQIHWANRSGKYLRDLSDWLRLCAKCHKKYDMKKDT